MKIFIEYCEKWNYHPEFDRVSKEIKKYNPNATIVGNASLPRTGSFEVTIDEKLIYSKFKTNSFPTNSEISNWFN